MTPNVAFYLPPGHATLRVTPLYDEAWRGDKREVFRLITCSRRARNLFVMQVNITAVKKCRVPMVIQIVCKSWSNPVCN